MTEDKKQKVVRQYQKGWSINQIRLMQGITNQQIKEILQEAGVEVRKRGAAWKGTLNL